MSETLRDQITLGEVIASHSEVATEGNIPLENALEKLGYGITSFLTGGERIIVIRLRSVNSGRPDTIALRLSLGGLYHSPEHDLTVPKSSEVPAERLVRVEVSDLFSYSEFTFKSVSPKVGIRMVKLKTLHQMEDVRGI